MNINSVNIFSFGHNPKAVGQAAKIIRSVTDKNAKVICGSNGFKVSIPGKDGCMIVNGSTDILTLSKDFATVQKAREAGILKPKHVTRIGL